MPSKFDTAKKAVMTGGKWAYSKGKPVALAATRAGMSGLKKTTVWGAKKGLPAAWNMTTWAVRKGFNLGSKVTGEVTGAVAEGFLNYKMSDRAKRNVGNIAMAVFCLENGLGMIEGAGDLLQDFFSPDEMQELMAEAPGFDQEQVYDFDPDQFPEFDPDSLRSGGRGL